MPIPTPIWIRIAAVVGTSFVLACQASGRGEVREWRASDHDQAEVQDPERVAPPSMQQQQQRDGGTVRVASASSPHQQDTGEMARAMQVWAAQCMRCHGQIGAGDGPDGVVLGATNLTDAGWQNAVSDSRIALSIRGGRGRMPAFSLGSDTVDALVKLIRQMGAGKGPDDPSRDGAAQRAESTTP